MRILEPKRFTQGLPIRRRGALLKVKRNSNWWRCRRRLWPSEKPRTHFLPRYRLKFIPRAATARAVFPKHNENCSGDYRKPRSQDDVDPPTARTRRDSGVTSRYRRPGKVRAQGHGSGRIEPPRTEHLPGFPPRKSGFTCCTSRPPLVRYDILPSVAQVATLHAALVHGNAA